MNKIKQLKKEDWPEAILEINDPPLQLNYRGEKPDWSSTFLAVVGSRRYSQYGKEVCEKLILGLRGYDITIVSGLALGIDGIAHKAALNAGLKTISVPGSGLDDSILYPATNRGLAKEILKSGGTLLSEFDPLQGASPWSFPQRNRIMAGLSKATLIIEATDKSGTLITARLALDYNREICVVPASIFSRYAVGSNKLLHQGATTINCSEDLLEVLGFNTPDESFQKELNFDNCSTEEKLILELLKEPQDRNEVIHRSKLSASQANILISSLEIKGYLKESLGKLHLN